MHTFSNTYQNNIKADLTLSRTCLLYCREKKISSLTDSMKTAQDEVQTATERHSSLMDQLQVFKVISLLLVAQWLAG